MNRKIVITGVGLLTPLGDTLESVWCALMAGETAVRDWPDLAVAGFRCARACRITSIEVDPLRRGRALAIAAAEQAVKQAGLSLPEGSGVFIGSTLGESAAFERAAEGLELDLADYGVPSFTAGVRERFGLSGPQQSLATACTAGNYAVGNALFALRAGRCEVALAGGVEPFSRLSQVRFSRARAMAADLCRPFDARRSGMLLGEGAAVFVMEHADGALRRGAIPLAEVVGLGLSCDAYHPTAPHPDGIGMRAAMQAAIDVADIAPADIDWVNTHGSGTRASDAAEAKALHGLFGVDMPSISGSKGALGHALGAASAIELAICVQGLRHQAVPPTPGHEQPDAEGGIPCTRSPVARRLRWVLNNAFAFGGLNSSLLLGAWTD